MDRPVAPAVPTSSALPAWFPYLWSRVVCAGGSQPVSQPWTWAALAWLLLVPGVLLYPSLYFPLFEPDESRYAQIPAEMLQRNDWVVPTLQSEPYLDKPPLMYWCVLAAYSVFGMADGVARLVPALALHLTILSVYFLGRRTLGERAAFRGALMLALAPGFPTIGRLLLLDGLLALFTTVGLLTAFEAVRTGRLATRWWLAAAVACGLGTLTKGPIAVVLVLGPILLHCFLVESARISWRAWALFLGVVAVLNVPWYVAISLRVPNFLGQFIWDHHLQRYFGSFAHEEGFFYYVPVVLFGLLPGSLLLLPFARWLLSGDPEQARQRTTELGFCLLAGCFCVALFSLSSCKLPTYVMPALPPLALALGYYLGCSGWHNALLTRGVAVGMFLCLVVGHHLLMPWYAEYRSPFRLEQEIVRLCADPEQKVVCYPRTCDSVAFYLGRRDMINYRSKDIEDLRALVRAEPRVVILCTHRSSLQGLRELLPPETPITETVHVGLPNVPWVPDAWQRSLKDLLGKTSLGLADLAVVERR